MEHRLNKRKQVNFDVILNHQTLGRIRGVARNLSSEGMYIAGAERSLPANIIVTVQFCLGSADIVKDAIVIHSNVDGAGVLFNQPLTLDVLQ